MEQQLRVLRIVHAAMLLAAVIYVFLSEAVKRDRGEELSQATYVAVAVMAALSMRAALMVRQAMVGRALECSCIRKIPRRQSDGSAAT